MKEKQKHQQIHCGLEGLKFSLNNNVHSVLLRPTFSRERDRYTPLWKGLLLSTQPCSNLPSEEEKATLKRDPCPNVSLKARWPPSHCRWREWGQQICRSLVSFRDDQIVRKSDPMDCPKRQPGLSTSLSAGNEAKGRVGCRAIWCAVTWWESTN